MNLRRTPDDKTMDTDSRIALAQMTIDIEWDLPDGILFVAEDAWKEHFLDREDVDPLNVHKPYGLTTPFLIKDVWRMGVCVPALIRPVEQCSVQDLSYWLAYWMEHMKTHLVVMGRAASDGESNLPLSEIEDRVTETMATYSHSLHEFGERVKRMQLE